MAQIQVQDIIYAAFRISGVLGNALRSFQPTGSNYTDAFNILNAMLDQWNTDRLLINSIQQFDFPLKPGIQQYTIGPGGDWDYPRPSKLERANVVLISENPQAPLEIPLDVMTIDGWKSIPQKNTQSTFPTQIYYDQGFSNPGGVGNMFVFPIPNIVNNVRLWLWVQFQPFVAVTDPCYFPPGYLKAIQYNLAVELAQWFPERQRMSPKSYQIAEESLKWIRELNIPMLDMSCDNALVNRPAGVWNWRTGTYQGQPY